MGHSLPVTCFVQAVKHLTSLEITIPCGNWHRQSKQVNASAVMILSVAQFAARSVRGQTIPETKGNAVHHHIAFIRTKDVERDGR